MFCSFSGDSWFSSLSIGIGNFPSVDTHTKCASRTEEIPVNTSVTLPCEGTGRYISIKKIGGIKSEAMIFCEVVVNGYKYIGKRKHSYQ